MVSRIQNRNNGYSDSLFSHNTRVDSNTISSIDGATALKLDENYEVNDYQNDPISNYETTSDSQKLENTAANEETINDISSGVSIESASYIENNVNDVQENINTNAMSSDSIVEEYTPKLFSEDQSFQENTDVENNNDQIQEESEQLFDQDTNEEEDFEIPAFLRKQKF